MKPGAESEVAGRGHRALQEQWFLRGRSSPGQSGAAQRYRAHLQKMQMRAARPARAQKFQRDALPAALVWTPLGPAPLASDASGVGEYNYGWVSGRATAVAIDPADPTGSTVYIGGAYGGVWKSTNATQAVTQDSSGVTWTALTDNQATLAVGAIAIQPGNNNPNNSVILVGTGETNSSADSYYGLGILRSADAGSSWSLITEDSTQTRSFAGMGFSKIAFNSNAPNIAVAATAGASEGIIEGLANPLTANLGLYYSGDSGLSWTFASVSDGSAATAPGSATSVVYNASANNGNGLFFAALRYHGFYSSPDGVNWTRLANQPGGGLTGSACPASPSSSSCPIYRGEIAVVPGRNEMYVWYVDANDFDQGIWESTNSGSSWTQISDAGIINCGDEIGCGTEQGSYNLELAAVPNGNSGVTDLYAGAINLYKCEISSGFPVCNPNAPQAPPDATFLNLTHAYGCSSIAEVHPAQHAVAFLVNNGTEDVMFFANDGGIYRALNGYTDLTTGTCGSTNQFDSLNMTLGSMTQFISFSQSPSDASTILGGTQGNGSPGTQSTGSSWQNVNFGDGGYTQISPVNELLWFVSNPPDATSGVNIFSCASGINCHTQDFQNTPVVTSATVGGDTGPYYPPYILDPLNAEEMMVGTCRMWRGSTGGGAFTVLSHSFETGGDGICTGAEINLVRSLAAGVLDTSTGLSKVIYAGTDGDGPLIPTTPPGGHVWVSTNVAAGPSTWIDQTGSINPNNFPISGIAMDRSDHQGLTAYVSIMGFSSQTFPTSHVWQTTNGGFSWTDFTANLPNAPANAVLVDPGTVPTNGTLYVGTDVGVFSSSTSAPNWTEVGPAPGSGHAGYLPNVAVTALGMFIDEAGNKWLRASTYGRGVWQFLLTTIPDFSLSVSNTPLTVFVGQQPAEFNGSVFALDGYNFSVTMSCIAGSTPPPPTCSVAPGSIVPSELGTPFTVTASGTPQSYAFYVQGAGTDPDTLTHDSPVTLNVVDFNLTAPVPPAITVGPSSTSAPVSFQVTAQGPFDDTVNLSCGNLPSGATCNFYVDNQAVRSVNPTSSSPAKVMMTVSTTSSATGGTFPTAINGSVTNGPTKTQSLSLTITMDYALTITHPSLQAVVNSTVNFNGVLTSLNGYNSAVNLSCGQGAPPTCSAAPASVVPTTNGAAFIVTVGSGVCGTYDFDIVATGTDQQKTTHLFPVTFTATSYVQPGYTLEISNSPQTDAVNTPTIFNGSLQGTNCYSSPVNLSCGSNHPPSCTVSPRSLVPTVSPAPAAPFTVTVSSNAAQTYNFNIVGVGTDANKTTHAYLATFTSTGGGSGSGFAFTLTSNPDFESVPAGQPAIYDLNVTPTGGSFPNNVALAFSGNCPPLSTCALSSTQVIKGSGDTHVTFTITTTAPVIARLRPSARPFVNALWLSSPGLMVIFGGVERTRRRRRRSVLFFMLIVLGLFLELACGGGLQGNGTGGSGQNGTPPGTYTMTVTGTASSFPQQSAQVQLTVN
ncbi:MAG: hypothetical protein WB558_08100 [Terriglobales bacterium]